MKVINKLEVWKIIGKVTHTNKFSETHVSGSGGGRNSPVSISSRAVTKQEFYIKTEEGKDVDVKLSGVDIPIAIEQKLTLLYGRKRSKSKGPLLFLFNHMK